MGSDPNNSKRRWRLTGRIAIAVLVLAPAALGLASVLFGPIEHTRESDYPAKPPPVDGRVLRSKSTIGVRAGFFVRRFETRCERIGPFNGIEWFPNRYLFGLVVFDGETDWWGNRDEVRVSAFLPLLLFGAVLICSRTWRFIQDRRKPSPGHCPTCGYNLTGNVSGRCPECGAATAED